MILVNYNVLSGTSQVDIPDDTKLLQCKYDNFEILEEGNLEDAIRNIVKEDCLTVLSMIKFNDDVIRLLYTCDGDDEPISNLFLKGKFISDDNLENEYNSLRKYLNIK